jgi:hypothetical protein
MLRKPEQARLLFRILGYGVIPFLIVLPFLVTDPITYNYTGLINNGYASLFYFCMIPAGLWLFALLIALGEKYGQGPWWRLSCAVLLALCIAVALVPYHTKEDFLSGLHVFLGFIVFMLLQTLMVRVVWIYTKLRNFYFGALILAWFVSLTFASINGLAEVIFLAALSVTLTALITSSAPSAQ